LLEAFPGRNLAADGRAKICADCVHIAKHGALDVQICTLCGVSKPLATFNRQRGRTSGHSSHCKACKYENGFATTQARGRAWRKRNADKQRTKLRQWREANAEHVNACQAVRRTRQRASGGSLALPEWQMLCAVHNYRCLSCKETRPLTIDHIVPVSMCGRGELGNVQPLCQPCNSRKGASVIDYRKMLTAGSGCAETSKHGAAP
jgi:5-methylcytosine-specific restriction endonuclease McrA